MNDDYLHCCTSAASISMPPVTIESLLETKRLMEAQASKMRAKAKATEFLLRVEYGPECVLPSEDWPFAGIAIDLSSEDGRRLMESLKKHLGE